MRELKKVRINILFHKAGLVWKLSTIFKRLGVRKTMSTSSIGHSGEKHYYSSY